MKRWRVVSRDGVIMGIYPGITSWDALDAMARDAGYRSQADAIARGIAPFNGWCIAEEIGAKRGAHPSLTRRAASKRARTTKRKARR